MQWLNTFLPNLRAEPYTDATTLEYGIYWRLLAYCVQHENYGKIAGAGAWSERKWLLSIGCEPPSKENTALWYWTDGTLFVHGYPNAQQRKKDSRASARERLRKHREEKRLRNAHETPVKRETFPNGNAHETPVKRHAIRLSNATETPEKR